MNVGDAVVRLDGGYTRGRRGMVLAIAEGRARVDWAGAGVRTWVRLTSLRGLSTADTVRGPWVETPMSRHHSAVRVCTKPSGETWHEYQRR